MAQKSPNSVDVLDIQFKLHKKIQLFNIGEALTNNFNLLAISSAHGILAAGDPEKPEFKIFLTKSLIESEKNGSDLLVRIIPLPAVASNISCSCDGNMLAVAYILNGSSFLQIFNTVSLLTGNISLLYKISLSSDNDAACQKILWNPVISSNLAIILSNGALSMYNLKDSGQYEMHNLDKSQQVQCGCWSPKGKQIVLGFANGRLQQFKPDLTAAKTIACPPGVHSGPFSTIAVHWLSTFQFAAVFLQDGPDNIPSLYIVNAPKNGNLTYINYYDVCCTTGQRQHRVDFTHIQQWNLLLVSSSNGIEVGLLGCRDSNGDTPTWVQYTLLDEARIELPLTESKDETFPIGFALDLSSTHRVIINEDQLPIMPMIHVLSTNGILLSFNFLNLIQGAMDICSPPPPISFNTQNFKLLKETLKAHEVQKPVVETTVTPSNIIASTPLIKDKSSPFFGSNSSNSFMKQTAEQLPSFGNISKSADESIASTKTKASTGPSNALTADSGGVPSGLSFAGIGAQQTQFQPQIQQQQQIQKQHSNSAISGVKSSELNKPLYTVSPDFKPPTSTAITAQPASNQKGQKSSKNLSKAQSGFLELINAQIATFDKEIKHSGIQSKGLLKNVGNPDEMRNCTKRLNDLIEILEQANDHEFEMDVQSLRHSLNEARAMVAECRWKIDKYNNPDLPRLGNNTSNPVNRRQLTKLQSYVTANEAQLQLLKYLIDVQWSNFQDSIRRNTKSKIHIPCMDGIYQRMTKMQETLVCQRNKLNRIKSKLQQNGLLHKAINSGGIAFINGKNETTMDSLADSILSMTLAPVVDEEQATLSNEKLNAIRDFVSQRKTVNIIKAQRPNRVGLRSEVVLETMLQSERSKMRDVLNTSKSMDQKEDIKHGKEALLPLTNLATTKTVSSAHSSLPGPNFSFGSLTSFTKTSTAPINQTSSSQGFKLTQSQQQNQSSLNLPKASIPSGIATSEPITATTTVKKPIANKPTHTPEDEVVIVPQSPVSFAAKVIGGTSAPITNITANNLKLFESSEFDKDKKKIDSSANKPFTFTPTSGANNEASNNSKPSLFDAKNVASFSFSNFAANKSVTTTTPSTFASIIPKPVATGFFSGFGKQVGSENIQTSTAPLNLSQNSANISKTPLLSETPTLITSSAPVSSITKNSDIATTVSTATDTSTTSTSDATAALFGEINICKPSTKADAKPSTNLFSGFGTAGSSFSFTPVTGAGSSFSFADLTKSADTKTSSPFSVTSSMTSTATNAPAAVSVPSTSKPAEFSFNLDALGTTVTSVPPSTSSLTTTATTAATNTTIFTAPQAAVAVSKTAPTTGIFASVASSTPSNTSAPTTGLFASVTSSTPSSTAASVFGSLGLTTNSTPPMTVSSTTTPVSVGIFSSVVAPAPTMTTNATTVSNSSLFSSVPPSVTSTSLSSSFGSFSVDATTTTSTASSTTGSIFASATVNAPSSANVFGEFPKPEQSVFAASSTPQSPSTGLFAAAAQNVSPFATATTSAPPNQTVSSGGIFGSGFSFAKPTTTAPITSPFGVSTTTTATGGSIFGKTSENLFSSATRQAAAPAANASSGNSIFGQNIFGSAATPTSPTTGLFANASQTEQTPFGGNTSIFGGTGSNTSGVSGGSLFGTSAAFGSPSGTTGSTGFGAFSQPNTGSQFSFGQNTSPVAQSAFGSPQQQTSPFSKPVFGGPPTFGSPPAFGAQPTFGGAATFGAQKSPFGSFATPAATTPNPGVFSPATQQSNLFETLGSTDTGLSFGNLAQGANGSASKPTFGGSSFTSYRS